MTKVRGERQLATRVVVEMAVVSAGSDGGGAATASSGEQRRRRGDGEGGGGEGGGGSRHIEAPDREGRQRSSGAMPSPRGGGRADYLNECQPRVQCIRKW